MEAKKYELTTPQKSIYLLEKFYSGTNLNNICGTSIVHSKLDFDTLKKAIELTFLKRKTILPENPTIFESEFHNNKEKQQQWMAFLRKNKIKEITYNFNEVMERITKLLKPIVITGQDKTIEEKTWAPIDGIWR